MGRRDRGPDLRANGGASPDAACTAAGVSAAADLGWARGCCVHPGARSVSGSRALVDRTRPRGLQVCGGCWGWPRTSGDRERGDRTWIAARVGSRDAWGSGSLLVRRTLSTAVVVPIQKWLNERENDATRADCGYVALTSGLLAATSATGDESDRAALIGRLHRIRALFESDSFGESLQHWGYAAHHMIELRARLLADSSLPASTGLMADEVDHLLLEPLSRCLPWVSASIIAFQGDVQDGLPVALNFGDSARTWRPPAEVLAALAASRGEHAGLAAWLLERSYPVDSPAGPLASIRVRTRQRSWMALRAGRSTPCTRPSRLTGRRRHGDDGRCRHEHHPRRVRAGRHRTGRAERSRCACSRCPPAPRCGVVRPRPRWAVHARRPRLQ